ncbi:MAG TPA: AAA family ATPase [Desulfobacterales bacterium]|nr:AAA family ATPase [Desulfobacterales bacterium]
MSHNDKVRAGEGQLEKGKDLPTWKKIEKDDSTSIEAFLENTIDTFKQLLESSCRRDFGKEDESKRPKKYIKGLMVAWNPLGSEIGSDSFFFSSKSGPYDKDVRDPSGSKLGKELIFIINEAMKREFDPKKAPIHPVEYLATKKHLSNLARSYGSIAASPIRPTPIPGHMYPAYGAVVILYEKVWSENLPNPEYEVLLPEYAELCFQKLAPDLVKEFVWTKSLKAVLEQVKLFAKTSFSVFLIGERGVGKTHVAREIHRESGRPQKRFFPIPCSAHSLGILEATLFGCIKGVYTDATDREGVFELYDRGTVFLDEIANISSTTQEKLLHFLQTKTFTRYGGTKSMRRDIRLIFATNNKFSELQEKLMPDFLDRILLPAIVIPPLRDRRGDIVPLAENFLHEFSLTHKTDIQLSPEAAKELKSIDYSGGNIHILERVLQTAFARSYAQGRPEIVGKDIKWADNLRKEVMAWETANGSF